MRVRDALLDSAHTLSVKYTSRTQSRTRLCVDLLTCLAPNPRDEQRDIRRYTQRWYINLYRQNIYKLELFKFLLEKGIVYKLFFYEYFCLIKNSKNISILLTILIHLAWMLHVLDAFVLVYVGVFFLTIQIFQS